MQRASERCFCVHSIRSLFLHVRHKRNGCREIAVMADADFTHLSVEIIDGCRCNRIILSDGFSCSACSICCGCRYVWSVKNETSRTRGLMFSARRRSNRDNHYALEAALEPPKLVACFTNSFLCCKPKPALDNVVANINGPHLPAKLVPDPDWFTSTSAILSEHAAEPYWSTSWRREAGRLLWPRHEPTITRYFSRFAKPVRSTSAVAAVRRSAGI